MSPKKIFYLQLFFAIFFTTLIYFIGYIIPNTDIVGFPRRYAFDYPWKYVEPQLFPILTAIAGFALHQLSAWYVLYKAQKAKTTYSNELGIYNYWMIGIHFTFILLHFLQTIFFYDALAQITPEWLSQVSVIILLILVLIILNDKRGILFGKHFPIPQIVSRNIKKYHGYYMLLAMIFTFWFHPMESTIGHLVGFLYMFMLFTQSGLMYTKLHLSNWWIYTLEISVLIHGVTVAALVQNSSMWTMFFAGFGFLAVFSQAYIFQAFRKNLWLKIIVWSVYIASLIVIYSGAFVQGLSYSKAYQLTWIPIIEILGVYIIVAICYIPYIGRNTHKLDQ